MSVTYTPIYTGLVEREILDPIITPSALKEILIDAGKYNGLLEFRPLFGLFAVETFEKIKGK